MSIQILTGRDLRCVGPMNELPVGGSELKPSMFLMLVDPRRRRRMRRVVLVARALGFWCER